MTLIQIINTILVLILPGMIAWCYVIAQFQIQHMPTHQRGALEQFSRMAVRHVMQQPEQLNQKAIATAYAIDLFKAFKLPVPSPDVLEMAVSSALYEIAKNG